MLRIHTALSVSIILCEFNVLNLALNDLRRKDVKSLKLFILYKMHHAKADYSCVYLLGVEDDRGLIRLEL